MCLRLQFYTGQYNIAYILRSITLSIDGTRHGKSRCVLVDKEMIRTNDINIDDSEACKKKTVKKRAFIYYHPAQVSILDLRDVLFIVIVLFTPS